MPVPEIFSKKEAREPERGTEPLMVAATEENTTLSSFKFEGDEEKNISYGLYVGFSKVGARMLMGARVWRR